MTDQQEEARSFLSEEMIAPSPINGLEGERSRPLCVLHPARRARAPAVATETMSQTSWGYSKENGPDRWHETYPFAKGNNQSPVAILTKDVYKDPALLPWFTGYDPGASKNISNTGRTCRVTFDDTFDRSVLRGGPLQGIYRLRYLHIRVGSTDDKGSEHVVDARRHAGEIHLVHWYSKYSNYADALRKPDGVAIVAILLQVGKDPKPEIKRIIEELPAIRTKGKEVPFQNFDPSIIFPQNRNYWTYQGSFTTPPCEECVTWILLKEPITVSEGQILKLRGLSSNTADDPHCPLVDNYRPLQPLNTRMVRTTCQ